MKKLIIAPLILFGAMTHAQAGIDGLNRLPTKDELVTSFTESFKSAREKAAEWYAGNQARIDFTIAANTVTDDQIEKVAEYTENSLQRQVEICKKLQDQYPGTKDASCITGVLMVNGLGHADEHRLMMDAMADKEKVKLLKHDLYSKDANEQMQYSIKTLKLGVGAKNRGRTISVVDVESALGNVSTFTEAREAVEAALQK